MRPVDADAIPYVDLNSDMPQSDVRVYVAFKDRIDKLPTIEPSDDLISREDAIEALGEEPDIWNDTEEEWAYRNAWVEHISAIKSLPSADRPTGECKTCKRCSDYLWSKGENGTKCPIEEHYALPKDGYCHLYEQI